MIIQDTTYHLKWVLAVRLGIHRCYVDGYISGREEPDRVLRDRIAGVVETLSAVDRLRGTELSEEAWRASREAQRAWREASCASTG